VSIAGTGSRLLGGTLSAELSGAEVDAWIVDGFFPALGGEAPSRGRMALQELGLPYATDPAITRHLEAFLAEHAKAAFEALGSPERTGVPRPDAVLLNGGVFNSPRLSSALLTRLSALWPEAPPLPLLEHSSLDLAVARGAAYYGLVRRGLGRRIGGGAARAYYVGLGGAEAARGVCLIPRGFEEGTSVDLKDRPFQLALGRPVQFALYSTSADRVDKPGDVVALESTVHPEPRRGADFRPLPPIHSILRSSGNSGGEVPVHLRASLTEIGTLELWCVSAQSDERWRLEFDLRGSARSGDVPVVESMPARFAEAAELVSRLYGHKPLPVGPKDIKQLVRSLEKILGPRDGWRLPVLRELWSALYAGASKRRRSADHERVFFQLLGFCLRPGFGYPLDAWRCEQTFALFKDLVQFHTEKPVWIEHWVMWRRVAAGLNAEAHQAIYAYLKPHLSRRVPLAAPVAPKLKGIIPEGLDEMVRAAAALEHLNPSDKEELGNLIVDRIDPAASGGPWAWALGRLGTREPLYGSAHRTVTAEVASLWLERLLATGLARIDGAPFAAAQLARRTGDRARDLDEALLDKTMSALKECRAPDGWLRMVREVVTMDVADQSRALGDTLPLGLRL
jgi:hypothetical protein